MTSAERRPGIEMIIARLREEQPQLSAKDAAVEAKRLWTTPTITIHASGGRMVEIPNPDYRGGRPV